MNMLAGLLPANPFHPGYMQRFSATGEMLNQVPYRNGDVFDCLDEKEEVMVDTVSVENGNLYIKLVSLDKTFNGEPLEYKVSEQMLKKYYIRSGKSHPAMPEGNYSVTAGD